MILPPSNHHSTVWDNRFLTSVHTFVKSYSDKLLMFFQLRDIQKQLASTGPFKSPMFRCTSIGGACGTFPPAEARRDEGLNLPGPAVLGYIRLLAQSQTYPWTNKSGGNVSVIFFFGGGGEGNPGCQCFAFLATSRGACFGVLFGRGRVIERRLRKWKLPYPSFLDGKNGEKSVCLEFPSPKKTHRIDEKKITP